MISKKEFYTQGNACPVCVVLYDNPDVVPKACILYFHGGGLLYGHSDDLPRTHLERLTSTGYPVASFEYPLAPAADLRMILSSVTYSINHYLCHPEQYVSHKLPYVLFGRSARSLPLPDRRCSRSSGRKTRRNPLLLRIRLSVRQLV